MTKNFPSTCDCSYGSQVYAVGKRKNNATGSINWGWLLTGREGTMLLVALTGIGCCLEENGHCYR